MHQFEYEALKLAIIRHRDAHRASQRRPCDDELYATLEWLCDPRPAPAPAQDPAAAEQLRRQEDYYRDDPY